VAFLLLCLCWSLLRTVYFFFVFQLDGFIPLLIYWLPVNVMFATFSLLVVFYAHLHHKQKAEWKAFKRKYLTVWAALSIIFLILGLVWIFLGLDMNENSLLLIDIH